MKIELKTRINDYGLQVILTTTIPTYVEQLHVGLMLISVTRDFRFIRKNE
jgi:hypothetical protein